MKHPNEPQYRVHQPNVPYGRVSLFFLLIYLVVTWGFYRTYLIFFPSFAGFRPVQHFHGAMMTTWMVLLIVQPLLIRRGKYSVHRLLGRLSFILAPLVLLSMYLITKFSYYKPGPPMPYVEKVGGLSLQTIDIVEFALFYSLAIANRRNTHDHVRYFVGTAVMMIGPSLGRGLIMYSHISPVDSLVYTFLVQIVLVAAFLLKDIAGKRSYKANAVVLSVIVIHLLLWQFRLYEPWQSIGKFIASNLL